MRGQSLGLISWSRRNLPSAITKCGLQFIDITLTTVITDIATKADRPELPFWDECVLQLSTTLGKLVYIDITEVIVDLLRSRV